MTAAVRRPSRPLAFVLLLLHALVVLGAPAADARAERVSADATVHVEAQDHDGDCATPHDHLACGLCRAIGDGAHGAEAATVPCPSSVAIAAPRVGAPLAPTDAPTRRQEPARAPPSV